MAGPRYTRLGPGGYPVAAGGSVSVPIVQVLNEQVHIVDVLSVARPLVRLLNETVQAIEQLVPALTLNRMVSETAQLVEVIVRTNLLTRAVGETVRLSEAFLQTRAISTAINEVQRLTEALLTSSALARPINESVHIGENLLALILSSITKVVNETERIVEVVMSASVLNRMVNESERIGEALLATQAINRLVNETVRINEAFVLARARAVMFAETINLSEVGSGTVGLIRQVAETLRLSEVTNRVSLLTRAIAETVRVNEVAVRSIATDVTRVVSEFVRAIETKLPLTASEITRIINELLRPNEGGGAPTGPASHLLTSFTIPASDNRNDFTGEVGVRINTTVVQTYTWIGLLVHPGDTGIHTVNLYEWFSSTVVATANFDLTGKTPGAWLWAAIPPVTVTVNGYYALLKTVTNGDGQFWYNNSATAFDPAYTGNIYATYKPPAAAFGVTGADMQFVGLDLGWGAVSSGGGGSIITVEVINRMINETVRVVESLIPSRILLRFRDEAVRLSEGLVIYELLTRITNETIRLVENVVNTSLLTRTIVEFENLVESTLRARILARSIVEIEYNKETDAPPTSLPVTSGLLVRLDAAQLPLADGASVTSWPNLGSSPNPGIYGTPPIFKKGVTPSGGPAVRESLGSFIHADVPGVTQDFTIFHVARMWGPNVGRAFSSNGWAFLLGFHGTVQDAMYDTETWVNAGVPYTAFPTAWKLYGADAQTAGGYASRFFINGVLSGTSNLAYAGAYKGLNQYNLGGYDMYGSESSDHETAELLIYDHKLTDAERISVEDHLRAKWLRLSGGPLAVLSLTRLLNEVLRINEVVNSTRSLFYMVNETLRINEAVLFVRSMVRILAETINVSETSLIFRPLVRLINELVHVIETPLAIVFKSLFKFVNETVRISETSIESLERLLIRMVNEALFISSALARTLSLTRMRNEIVAMNDPARIVSRARVFIHDEVINLLELPADFVRLIAKLWNENVAISEAHDITRGLLRTSDETVNPVEDVSPVRALIRDVSEFLYLPELTNFFASIPSLVCSGFRLYAAFAGNCGIAPMVFASTSVTPEVLGGQTAITTALGGAAAIAPAVNADTEVHPALEGTLEIEECDQMTAFVFNTNVLDLLELRSHIEGVFLPDATVVFTMKDKAGVEVPGETWPQVMVYVPGTDADFRGILPAALEMLPNKQYYAYIDAQGGGERIGHWEMPFKPLIRTGLPEGQITA